jgi:uncharacterized protein YkwD
VKLAALVMLLPAAALAQAVRYNDPPPSTARSPLVTRIDELVARVAKKQRRTVPKPDARLDAALTELLRAAPGDAAPPNELVQGALWIQGIVEPPPRFITIATDPGGEAELLRALAQDLPKSLAEGRFGRVGVGLSTARGGETRVLIALQEASVDLDPISRAQPLGASVLVRGKLRDGFERPEAFVTAPDGTVQSRILVGGDRVRFGGKFRCGPQKGRYQVEVAGEDRFGATVLANFPVWCGVAVPMTAEEAAPPRAGNDEAFSTAPAAEQTVWKLLNADRAQAGLAPLAWDGQLAAVARAHSVDMQAHHFFGHISPTTGSSADRAKKAGVDAIVIMENVARAFTAAEAERGLMNSPGHRANILSRQATHVGVGVVYDPDSREILVTQLFSQPPDRMNAHTVDDVRRAIDGARRARRLRPLEHDAALDNLAQSTARAMALSDMSTAQAGKRIDAEVSAQERWRGGGTVFAVVSTAQQAAASLGNGVAEPIFTHVGVGVEAGKRKEGGSGLYVVIVLATAR